MNILKPKSVIHFSTNDDGGAGSAAYKLHRSCSYNGYDSRLVVQKKTIVDSAVIQIGEFSHLVPKVLNKFEQVFSLVDEKYCYFDKGFSTVFSIDWLVSRLPKCVDVIILHSVSGFITLEDIEALQSRYHCKVYWHVLDMAPMTGGCHYAWDCTHYSDSCDECPATKWLYNGKSKGLLSRKQSVLNNLNIELLSPSSWLDFQLRTSVLFSVAKIHRLFLSVDEDVFFFASDRQIAIYRHEHGISIHKKVIAFGASSFSDERKGVGYFLAALAKVCRPEEYEIVTSGSFNIPADSITRMGFSHVHLGFLRGGKALSKFYQISDLYVSTSIEDSGPMMINEAIISGTPVVAFDMGVAADLVINNQTGYIAKLKDVDDLANGIESVLGLDAASFQLMKYNCRNLGLTEFSLAQYNINVKNILTDRG